MNNEAEDAEQAELVDKAIKLFTFLGRSQELLAKPVRQIGAYEKVIWFGDLPEHSALSSAHRAAVLDSEEPLLTIKRVPKVEAPRVPTQIAAWIDGPIDNPDEPPVLRDAIYVNQSESSADLGTEAYINTEDDDHEGFEEARRQRLEIADVPEVVDAFNDWMVTWDLWSDQERRDRKARALYQELFSTQLAATDHAEEYELIVGVGCLTWTPDGHDPVLRHLVSAPISITLDDVSGTIAVNSEPAVDSLTVELDMLDPRLITSPDKIDEIRKLARDYDGHLLDQQLIGDICRRLVHRLDANGAYDDEATKAPSGADPRGHFAPAIILRRRSARGLVEIYQKIVEQIRGSGEVPTGIVPLIDPDHRPVAVVDSEPGAIVPIQDEMFLPLPVNEVQLKIVRNVSSTAQTLVQGPPGTGKTHTAAALVSHLLAQGKRVLITAHTERALYEVRDKLPAAVRPLSVSIIGKSRSDMSELKLAVEQISSRASDFDSDVSRVAIESHLQKIDQLRRERSALFTKLLEARQTEVESHEFGSHEGTLARIAFEHLEQSADHEWIAQFAVDSTESGAPVSNDEIRRWHEYVDDAQLIADEPESQGRISVLAHIPTPEEFAELVSRESEAAQVVERHSGLVTHGAFEFVRSLDPSIREELRERVGSLADEASELEKRRESWMNDALTDIRSGRESTWITRRREISDIAEQVSPVILRIGFTTDVEVRGGNVDICLALAMALLEHVESGGKLKTLPDGSPKINALAPRVVKAAQPLFDAVRVEGLPPTTAEKLSRFIDWVEATRLLAAMGRTWPASVVVPEEDTLREDLQWHQTEAEQLDRVLELGQRLELEREWFVTNHLPTPDWNDLQDIRRYADLVEAAAAKDSADAATTPLIALEDLLSAESKWPEAPACFRQLLAATSDRELEGYVSAYARLSRLRSVANMTADRDDISQRLSAPAQRLVEAVLISPEDDQWSERWRNFQAAWDWDRTGKWILAQDAVDVNVLQQQLNIIENQIRGEVERLAAERAWGHAVSPTRLSGRSRADLTQYAQLVSRLGKGTGKYAPKQRVEIKAAMDRCRPAVPVWIMPIYRIAEQLRVQPDLYDVVIVDEASQAGLEATFLQYLAPKIVVIGDDKQVSPSAVGVDQQQLRDLANQYLAHDSYKGTWQDPKRSLFDEAKMRFGGVLTLTEHRRCVPEIIGFSNRIAYEPEGIRLVPVRQYGTDRLDPIQVVHVPDGYEGGNKTNPAEADAIVAQIEKCFADPRYDGATFGVISLLGKQQSQLIEHKLLDLVPPEEWSARQLRCGDATDFQGSERDVMFLSMVKAALPGERLYPLTKADSVQRFNVAASRAKDQMWVFHSMPKDTLTNSEDMRFQLLDYCYGVTNRQTSAVDGAMATVVPEDLRVDPFDSLFEQRVFNRLIDHGFTVVPQFDANGYKIDLVVVGAKGRLAVECDGDFWHGPDAYERDLSRQRDLERCGWEFFRIRESVFYADKALAMHSLLATLDELEIRTSDWIEPQSDSHEEPLDESGPDGVDDEPLSNEASAVPESQLVESSVTTSGAGRHRAADPNHEYRAVTPEGLVSSPVESESRAESLLAPIIARAETTILRPAFEPHGALAPYVEFTAPLRSVSEDRVSTIADNVALIVAEEGPVLGHRLHIAYVRATGGQRVGKEIARQLNRAITMAEVQGSIVADNPLNEAGVKPKTFRLSDQPVVVPRTLGPRPLDQVPIMELSSHVDYVLSAQPSLGEEELFRQVLNLLGLKRLTDNTQEILRKALRFAECNLGSTESSS